MKVSAGIFKEDSPFIRYYVPFGLMLISIFWKFNFIDYRDISMDEPFTIYHAQKDFKGMIDLLAKGEPNPPLFMILMHYWIKLFGLDPIAVRTLPLLFNTLTIPIVYSIGLRFFNSWTGLVAACLFILSEYQVFAGLEARTYSLMSLLVAASLYFYLIYLNDVKNQKGIVPVDFSKPAVGLFPLFRLVSHFSSVSVHICILEKFSKCAMGLHPCWNYPYWFFSLYYHSFSINFCVRLRWGHS